MGYTCTYWDASVEQTVESYTFNEQLKNLKVIQKQKNIEQYPGNNILRHLSGDPSAIV